MLSVGDIGSDSDPHSNIVAFAVSGGATTNASLTAATAISVPPYVVPFNSDMSVPLFTPTQPDGTSSLSANDARFAAKVYGVNGVLYAVHSTEVDGRIAVRWYRVSATTRTLLESGTISDPVLDLFFPCIAVNTNGTVVITCNGCSSSTYVSSFAIVGQTSNGVTSFGAPVLLESGLIDYHGDDELLAQLLDEPAISRWGDYSAISVDPTDSNRFWTIQMIPTDSDVWTTQVTEIITINPTASMTLSNNNAVISWPTSENPFGIESNTNLAAPNGWTPVTQNLSTNNGRVYLQTAVTNRAAFFRLHEQ